MPKRGKNTGSREEVTDLESIAYEIVFQNKSELPLQNLQLHYRIYYEQSETGTGNPEPVQYVLKAASPVTNIESDEITTLTTKAVEIFETDINMDGRTTTTSNPVTGGEGEIQGIRARLYMTLPSGLHAMREFSQPSSLSEKRFSW